MPSSFAFVSRLSWASSARFFLSSFSVASTAPQSVLHQLTNDWRGVNAVRQTLQVLGLMVTFTF
jgi:hypothetical protein